MLNGTKTIYPSTRPFGQSGQATGGIYEVDKTSAGAVTRTVTYYPAAGAMRINSTLYYILKDHLGSASVVTDASGTVVGEQRYYPYGETRVTTGSMFTNKLFTGQREVTGLGIYHYGARFYSPKLGRFISADTIVPGAANPQAYNRYSYVLNNPLRYIDPTGHYACGDGEKYDCDGSQNTTTPPRLPNPLPPPSNDDDDDDPAQNPLPPICTGPRWGNGECADFVEFLDLVPDDIIYCGNNFSSCYEFTALIAGFNGGVGAGTFNVVGGEDVFMWQNDLQLEAFGYYGQGSGAGGSLAPYFGAVFNLEDFESYRGPFITYNLTIQPVTVSYFHDENIGILDPGGVQGFSAGPGAGYRISGTRTIFEQMP